jgi:asparagine synthase (glutamine-hydrolysing)
VSAIAVLWRTDGGEARPHAARMLQALQIYGTHRQAIWSDGPVALAHALHRLVPEDRFDHQPLQAAGGTAVLAADLRLDNRDALIAALGIPTPEAARLADSDLVARAWERWGEDCLPRLVGDFAFAVWDARAKRVFCARSALGRRPLFFHRGNGFFAVATMPKGLLALPDVPKQLDEDRLAVFLAALPAAGADNPFAGSSFYKGIERIPPGSCLSFDGRAVSVREHWSPEHIAPVRFARDEDYVEQARVLFEQAVSSCLRATGPIGSNLSAGLDSSSVTVTAAELLAQRGERLTAFTAVPRAGEAEAILADRLADEGPGAAKIAAPHANVEHVRVPYPLISPLDPVARNLFAYDEPVRNVCNLAWIDEIGARARERHIAVMLEAPLGNATLSFDGFERLHELLAGGRLPSWLYEAAQFLRRRPLRQLIAHSLSGRDRNDLLRGVGKWWTRLDLRSPLAADSRAAMDERKAERLRGWSDERLNRGNRVRIIVYADPGTLVTGMLARHGFELRDPTGDRRFLEFCLALPLEQFYRDGQERRLVRRLMRGRLPDEILFSRLRGVQGVGWFRNMQLARGELREEIAAMSQSKLGSRLLDIPALERLLDDMPTEGGPKDLSYVAAYRHKVLLGAAAARFIRHVEGGN